jgi:NAD dependent epimerase/dehydratase
MRSLSGRRVFVTGADGFIGSHLCELLAAQGARVRGLALYNSFNDWGWLDAIDTALNIEVVAGDIRDPALTRGLMKDAEVVFHLASLIAIPYSYSAPQSYVETNVQGTLNVVQGALEQGITRLVHISTSEVYGTARRVPIAEDHPLQPQSPYSATKIAAEAIALSFHYAYQLPVVVARPFNTYGPRQSARAVIPTILTQLMNGRRKVRLGRVDPTRDFNYVTDTCTGIVALAGCDTAIGQTVNIGSGSETSIAELAALIGELAGIPFEIETDTERVRPEASEVERLVCDNRRIRELTNWEPRITLRAGLASTIDWFRRPENLSRYKAEVYNR